MTAHTTARVISVNTALAHNLLVGGRRMRSAIGKTARSGTVAVAPLGLEGDEQVELSLHGGLAQAVYAYPQEHYAYWQQRRAALGLDLFEQDLPHGTMGENLTIAGLLEHQVFVGDTLVGPNVVLRVTRPRQPCSKFNAVIGYAQAAKDMVTHASCGFYLAVEQAGSISAGEVLVLRAGTQEVSIAGQARTLWARYAQD
ncbi:MOSC domain-containing protein [Comamonadaceae bacterium M7527]|nr:MOSC domain-containing protein [Comamonadaceae bacterium M7527]